MPKEGAQKLPEGINYKEYNVNLYEKAIEIVPKMMKQ